jgi:hypothetical protein
MAEAKVAVVHALILLAKLEPPNPVVEHVP